MIETGGLTIRERRADDDPALHRIFNEAAFQLYTGAPGQFETTAASRAWLDSRGDTKLEIVADLDGLAIGFAGLYVLAPPQSHVAWLMMGVRQDATGLGIGRSLLRMILASADGVSSIHRVQLTVMVDNANAIHLYKAFDFSIEGRHKDLFWRPSGGIDAFTMARVRS